jgi:hypothetical protein
MLVVSHGRRSFVEKMMWTLKICNDCGMRGEWLHNPVRPYRAKIILQFKRRALPSATIGQALGLSVICPHRLELPEKLGLLS